MKTLVFSLLAALAIDAVASVPAAAAPQTMCGARRHRAKKVKVKVKVKEQPSTQAKPSRPSGTAGLKL